MVSGLKNRFNLVDEPWVPMADVGRVSLGQIFSTPGYRILGGNPVQKIAVRRLLLAIVQMACEPQDEAQWLALGPAGVARESLAYLQKWHDRFWLYGERPFLQMPAIARAKVQSFGAVLPEIAAGNSTVLTQSQQEPVLDDADKALLIVVLMGFPLGGKKADNSVVLTPGYTGKSNVRGRPATGRPGPAVAHRGLLHNYLLAQDLWHTLWLNLLTADQIQSQAMFPNGRGVAPWEQMPEGEACPVAERLKMSLMAHLVPMSRFCYLAEDGLHYSEGLAHPGYKEGFANPSVAVDYSGREPRALWVNPEKRPWRELSSLLAFVPQHKRQGFQCWRIQIGLDRATDMEGKVLFWSGGLRVSTNAGEQYVSGTDDFVESQVWLHSDRLDEIWFRALEADMGTLNELARSLYASVMAYFNELSGDGSSWASQATQVFWQRCEGDFQTLVDHCGGADSDRHQVLFRGFAGYAQAAYDQYCPRETARQLDAWAKCRPRRVLLLLQDAPIMDVAVVTGPNALESTFVNGLLACIRKDPGLAARLRRADNPDTEYESWGILAGLGVDLEDADQRVPFAIVAAALARARVKGNGRLCLGQAIAACQTHGSQSRLARVHLRRLLACNCLSELSETLRSVLALIHIRVAAPLDYVWLLRQLRQFATDPQAVKVQWAQEFHSGPLAGAQGSA